MPSQLFNGLGLTSGFTGDDPLQPFNAPMRGQLDQVADLRDYLANLVGYGGKAMNDTIKNDYSRLIAMYGKPLAEKILNHVFVFNNRSDIQKATPQERLNAFYATGSRDKELQDLFMKARNFGKGPIAGLNESSNIGSQLLTKRSLPLRSLAVPALAQSAVEGLK